jgi:pimeloyl-ACP methyl ester carboxylesterase
MRRLIALLLIVCLAGLIAVLAVGEVLCYPALGAIGNAPPDLPAESIVLHTSNNQPVAGWMVRGKPGTGAVLLLHGVRANRREMIGRARFLNHLGYFVLLIDLPGHGESTADHITYGINEAEGVKAALGYLSHVLPREKIGVIGVSLGAASIVLSQPNPAPSAVVLESMFPTITDATADRIRLHLGAWAEPLVPLLLWQLPLRLGVSPEQLQPIAAIKSLTSPVLIAAGSADQHTTLAETERIFEAANPPKELWIVSGAGHVDLHAYNPADYEMRISAFLRRSLR